MDDVLDDDLDALMSDEGVETVTCRFVEGETVEWYHHRKWKPVKVLSINNLIFDQDVKKTKSESFVRYGFDFFVKVKASRKTYNVLQNSKLLAYTNTHIHKGGHYYARMRDMMRQEPARVKDLRARRERQNLAAVRALDKGLQRVNPNRDTLALRAHFSQFVKDTTIHSQNIKPSGVKARHGAKRKK